MALATQVFKLSSASASWSIFSLTRSASMAAMSRLFRSARISFATLVNVADMPRIVADSIGRLRSLCYFGRLAFRRALAALVGLALLAFFLAVSHRRRALGGAFFLADFFLA